MWSFIRGEPSVITRVAGPLVLAGLFVGVAAAQFEFPGVIAATFVVGLGASGGSLVRWRTDHGLWMLAGLLLLIHSAIYAVITLGGLNDFLRGAPGPDMGILIDFTVGTTILTTTIRFLRRIVRDNWSISRHRGVA